MNPEPLAPPRPLPPWRGSPTLIPAPLLSGIPCSPSHLPHSRRPLLRTRRPLPGLGAAWQSRQLGTRAWCPRGAGAGGCLPLGRDEVPALARGLRCLANLGMRGSGYGQGHSSPSWRAPVPVTRRKVGSPGSPLLSRPGSCGVRGTRFPSAGMNVGKGESGLRLLSPPRFAWEEERN